MTRTGLALVLTIAAASAIAGQDWTLVCDFTQVLDPGVREAKLLSGDLATRYEVYLRYSTRYVVVAARDVVIEVRRGPQGCSWSEVGERAPVHQIAVRPAGRIPT